MHLIGNKTKSEKSYHQDKQMLRQNRLIQFLTLSHHLIFPILGICLCLANKAIKDPSRHVVVPSGLALQITSRQMIIAI